VEGLGCCAGDYTPAGLAPRPGAGGGRQPWRVWLPEL